MSTKADFYIRKNKEMKWLGSIHSEGHPNNIPSIIKNSRNIVDYIDNVQKFLKNKNDGVLGFEGAFWPWPWKNSSKTEYSYTFDNGYFYISHQGGPWCRTHEIKGIEYPSIPKISFFPDMSKIKMPIIAKNSGLILR